MNKEEIENFEKIEAQLQAIFKDFNELTKKKADGPINKFKLGIINSLIKQAAEILGEKYKPSFQFEAFDDTDLPTNSDVVMVCGQFLSCLENKRADNIGVTGGRWVWRIGTNYSDIRTAPPKKIQEKE